ncbi:hypothetical protein Droror1_Dr00004830 [Drosera rotundifolia]
MPENMSISVNGQSRVPPGFRFHPTEEELLLYYLKKKVACQNIDLDVICEVDLNKLEPWDIQEKCKIGSTPQNDWYFFSHKDKKYPTGTRTNRATAAGFWKATGRDKMIYSSSRRIGMRKTLVFYKGRAPHGHKSDWIMHEYRLDENINNAESSASHGHGEEIAQEEGWVVCRIFKKKNYHKTLDSPMNSTLTQDTITHSSSSTMFQYASSDEGALEQIFKRPQTDDNPSNISPARPLNTVFRSCSLDKSIQLPHLLESPGSSATQTQAGYQLLNPDILGDSNSVYDSGDMSGFSDWASLDRLVNCHLGVQGIGKCSKSQLGSPNDHNAGFCSLSDHDHQDDQLQLSNMRPMTSNNSKRADTPECGDDIDLWSFNRSLLMDTLCHPSDESI